MTRSLPDPAALQAIEQRVLWLATRMIDHANRERPADEIKVGGHQASSASMVSIMTSLWFGHIDGNDKVAVKPHASPVFHSIKYLMGELDRSYLTRLRERGGLQAYPSRTKDPDVRDFSTGSVGLGVVAPLFAAAARRYVDAHFGPRTERPPRFIALAGDAELDEGNIWEAVLDPAVQGLGNVMMVVDTNRQSLDRVVPDQKIKKSIEFFESVGWHVVECKYGSRLTEAFSRPGGETLRAHIDNMSNEEYQSLFVHRGAELRERFLSSAPSGLREFLDAWDDASLQDLLFNLGGHDAFSLIEAYRACDRETDRPSVVFAYTVKGWGLPIAGDPLNHSALLSAAQIDELRAANGLDLGTEWDRFDPQSPAGRLCAAAGGEINNKPVIERPVLDIPASVGGPVGNAPVNSQEMFGRLLARLSEHPDIARRMVTTSPDVSVSTNLGAWINKMGVFNADEQPDFLGDARLLKWKQGRSGHHIELGISEMNLFLMLHALGLSHDLHGEHLLPLGTVYDPFVCRGLDALIYALYNGARFVMVGTPSGTTLAPEGGAHQSSITPSIGLELPGLDYAEPAFARALDWLMCDGLSRLSAPDGTSLYLRLSTRPVDQQPFEKLCAVRGDDAVRHDVLAGGYRLAEPADGQPSVVLATCGAVVPEVLRAVEMLAEEGVNALVLDLTSPDRLYRGWSTTLRTASRNGRLPDGSHHLARLLHPAERRLPIVTVHDAASHHLAWLGGVFGSRVFPVGVDSFGESGSVASLRETFDMSPGQIVNTALIAVSAE